MVRPYTHHNRVHHNLIGPVHERRRVKTLHVLHARAHKNHWNPQLIGAVHDGLRAKFRGILLACDHSPYNVAALFGLIDYYQANPVPTVSAPVSSKVNDRPPSLHSTFTNSHFAPPLASDFCLYLSILRDFLRRHLLEFIGPSPSILIDPPCSRFSCRCSTMVTTCSTALALIAAVQDDHREKVRYLLQACGIDPQEILRILPRQKSILLLC